ncbi:MAG TPA: hypothetical protein VK752_20315 [Bryobacteraceae bacterium]|jgi:hypothetical protein|nr:hypothetical protein [Bryobacteraceae bacterium]
MRRLLVSLVILGTASAQETLPSAETILDRYIEATGGQARYDRVQNEIRHMTVTVSGQSTQILVYRSRSGEMHQIANGPNGKTELGVKNGIAWSRAGDVAHVLETGEELAQALQAADLLSDGHWRQYYKFTKTVRTDALDDAPCYVLEVVPFVGAPHTLWFNQKTGMAVKEVAPLREGLDGEATTVEYFEPGGIKIARVVNTGVNGLSFTTVVDDVKYNQPIPDAIFALPSDIERLLKKRYAGQ